LIGVNHPLFVMEECRKNCNHPMFFYKFIMIAFWGIVVMRKELYMNKNVNKKMELGKRNGKEGVTIIYNLKKTDKSRGIVTMINTPLIKTSFNPKTQVGNKSHSKYTHIVIFYHNSSFFIS